VKRSFEEARLTANLRHGMYRTGVYVSWAQMIQRCTNPKHKDFQRYSARGITVCARWRSFENFLADMGERPAGMTLDRKDNDGNYAPGNCRWATRAQQSHNSSRPVLLTHQGKTQNIAAWARELGLKEDTLHMRLHRGWPLERALTRRQA